MLLIENSKHACGIRLFIESDLGIRQTLIQGLTQTLNGTKFSY